MVLPAQPFAYLVRALICSCNELQASRGTLNLLPDDQSNCINSSRICVSPISSVFFVSGILRPNKGKGLRFVLQSSGIPVQLMKIDLSPAVNNSKNVWQLLHLLICQLLGKNPSSFAVKFLAFK